jgi:hypothetical protein
MIYVGVAVTMVVMTVLVAFSDQGGGSLAAAAGKTPASPTQSSVLLTLEAEDNEIGVALTREALMRSETPTP